MTDIINALRIESRREPHEPIWRDAIDEIEALRAEVDALREDAERWKVADACSAVVSDSGGGFVYQILIPFQGNLWRREGNQNDFFREDIDAARNKG